MTKKLEKILENKVLIRENDNLLEVRRQILEGISYDKDLLSPYVESKLPCAPYD